MKAPAPGSRPISAPSAGRQPGRVHLPLAVWIGAGVVGAHALFFWLVWNKHFLPALPPPPPTPPPVNFAARRTLSVDPRTGENIVERDFTVSTQLATPASAPAVSHSP